MVSKRPCRICRKWFQPNPRVGERQKVCSDPSCQRERHRRNCASWRQRNPDYDRETRVRQRLTEASPTTASMDSTEPKEPDRVRIDWRAARAAVGLEVVVLIEEFGEVLREMARDEVRRQLVVFSGELARHGRRAGRDEIGDAAPAR